MCHARERTQIEFPIEVSVNVFEHAVHPRRVFRLVRFLGQDCRLRPKAQLSLVTNGQNAHFILRNHKPIKCDVTSLSVRND